MTGDGPGARTDAGRPDSAGRPGRAGGPGTEAGADLEGRLAARVLDALLREDLSLIHI